MLASPPMRHLTKPLMPARVTFQRFCLILFLLGLSPLSGAQAATVTVFAAASLTDTLRELAGIYEHGDSDKIVLNLGASSTLARQIEAGAPADIFFSADEAKMDHLEQAGLLDSNTRRNRLSNSLVIIVAAEAGAAVHSPQDLLKPQVKRVALGDPRAVPIGVYARQYLERLGLWKTLTPKIVPTENVRAALGAVESGDADAAFVYKTDALMSKHVTVAFAVPPDHGPAISYPMALVKGAKPAAKNFLDFLNSDQAAKVFEKYGFRIINGQPAPADNGRAAAPGH